MLQWKTCLRAGVTVALVYLAIHYWGPVSAALGVLLGAAWPLLLGAGIAYVVNILMRFYETHIFRKCNRPLFLKLRRGGCMVAAYLTILVIVGLIVGLIVPELIRAVQLLLNETPALIDRLYGELMKNPEIAQYLPNAEANLGELGADWQQLLTRVLEWLGGGWNGLMNSVVATVSGVFSGAVTLVMGFMFSFYILYGKEKLGRQVRRLMRTYLKPAWCERTFYVLNVLDDSFHRYVVGQCTEAVILGMLCMLGMLAFGFPYATMIGALVGATALIPIAGAYIGAGVGAILILTVSPVEALLFLVFIVVLQQLEGNLIYPRVVGSQLGLPALWVLAAITVGGNVMGIGGMLLAVPLTTAIYRLVRENMRKRELAKGGAADAEKAPETAPEKGEAPQKPFAARKKK